ncbi:MAG: N-acetyl-gamma-glutamyl-phosphate reductase [Oscillospiraceae bacterium]|nr:N-acetyl-gamma-glutamyl-phosphate reductase [Oscillospiraceae bacterium]
MKPKVFIDGQEGTTGLQIFERLTGRDDIELLKIDEKLRKDRDERKKLMNQADLVILCLPDAAAIEAVDLIDNPDTRVIDASTAHRTAPGWDYGLPELSKAHRERITVSKRVANPGCHATGFISIVYPLVAMGILSDSAELSCFSLTGYSGGGKKMIAEYESRDKAEALYSPRIYGLNLSHKHLPEMMAVTGLKTAPVFCPIVDDYRQGMATSVPLHRSLLKKDLDIKGLFDALSDFYRGQRFITVAPPVDSGMLESNFNAGTNMLQISISGNSDRILVTSRFDNLGKGASGAAVQNMNIMLGFDESAGLV